MTKNTFVCNGYLSRVLRGTVNGVDYCLEQRLNVPVTALWNMSLWREGGLSGPLNS